MTSFNTTKQIAEAAQDTQPSPASSTSFGVTEETRIPLSGGRLKLSVPSIPGYHCHWFVDKADRIESAIRAGYEFVDKSETRVNNLGIATADGDDGGTDLGSRVSVVAGGEADGQAIRLVLLKLRQEWRDKDMRAREVASDRLVAALTRGQAGAEKMSGDMDASHRYLGLSGGQRPNPRTIFTKRT